MKPAYRYAAKIDRVIDGDSIEITISCGFDVYLAKQNCRLYGIDTSETRGGTNELKQLGILAKNYVKESLPEGTNVIIETRLDRRGKFGRILADVYVGDVHLNKALIDSQLAVAYHGQSKDELIEQHMENWRFHFEDEA